MTTATLNLGPDARRALWKAYQILFASEKKPKEQLNRVESETVKPIPGVKELTNAKRVDPHRT